MLPFKDDFLNSLLSNNYSDKTIINYRRDLDAFDKFMLLKDIPFEQMNRRFVDEFKGILRTEAHHELFGTKNDFPIVSGSINPPKRKLNVANSKNILSSSSINRMLSSLRRYLRYLLVNDLECPLPPDKIDFVKKEKKIMPLAEYDDLIKLIECPDIFERKEFVKKRNRAFLEILFSTGMRISEACNLNLDQLGHKDKSTDEFILNERIFISGKGKKQRFIYITPRCKIYLLDYIKLRKDDLAAVFIPTTGTRKVMDDPLKIRVSNNYFQLKIVQYRRRLGINVKTSAHSLRHGFATYMAEKGANVVALQTLLGHESLTTTTRYIHSSDKLAEQTHKEFHPTNSV